MPYIPSSLFRIVEGNLVSYDGRSFQGSNLRNLIPVPPGADSERLSDTTTSVNTVPEPSTFFPDPPKQSDRKRGYIFRYFCFNTATKKVTEISKRDYQKLSSNTQFVTALIKWYIQDPSEEQSIEDGEINGIPYKGLITKNLESLQIANTDLPGIVDLFDPEQFVRYAVTKVYVNATRSVVVNYQTPAGVSSVLKKEGNPNSQIFEIKYKENTLQVEKGQIVEFGDALVTGQFTIVSPSGKASYIDKNRQQSTFKKSLTSTTKTFSITYLKDSLEVIEGAVKDEKTKDILIPGAVFTEGTPPRLTTVPTITKTFYNLTQSVYVTYRNKYDSTRVYANSGPVRSLVFTLEYIEGTLEVKEGQIQQQGVNEVANIPSERPTLTKLYTNLTRSISVEFKDKNNQIQVFSSSDDIRKGRYNLTYQEGSLRITAGSIEEYIAPEMETKSFTNVTNSVKVEYLDIDKNKRQYTSPSSLPRTQTIELTYAKGTLKVLSGELEEGKAVPVPETRPVIVSKVFTNLTQTVTGIYKDKAGNIQTINKYGDVRSLTFTLEFIEKTLDITIGKIEEVKEQVNSKPPPDIQPETPPVPPPPERSEDNREERVDGAETSDPGKDNSRTPPAQPPPEVNPPVRGGGDKPIEIEPEPEKPDGGTPITPVSPDPGRGTPPPPASVNEISPEPDTGVNAGSIGGDPPSMITSPPTGTDTSPAPNSEPKPESEVVIKKPSTR